MKDTKKNVQQYYMLAEWRCMLNALLTPLLTLYTQLSLISWFQNLNSSVKTRLGPVDILKLCLYQMTSRLAWGPPSSPVWNLILLHSAYVFGGSFESIFCSFPFLAWEEQSLVWDLPNSTILGRLKPHEMYKQEVCRRQSSSRRLFAVMFTENE